MKTVSSLSTVHSTVPVGTFWDDGNIILTCIVILQVYTYVKTDYTVHLRSVHSTVQKISLLHTYICAYMHTCQSLVGSHLCAMFLLKAWGL